MEKELCWLFIFMYILGHPAPPENIWTSVFYSEMTLSKESGLRSLFGMKQVISQYVLDWCLESLDVIHGG